MRRSDFIQLKLSCISVQFFGATFQAEWQLVDANGSFDVVSAFNCRAYSVQFDSRFGGVSSLVDSTTQRELADAQHRLGSFIYQTMTESDFDVYIEAAHYAWTSHTDYGKYRLAHYANYSEHQYVRTSLVNLYRSSANSNEFLVEMDFGCKQDNLTTLYGAMHRVLTRVSFDSSTAPLTMELVLLNKTFSRVPEALYFGFAPLDCAAWSVDKIGAAVDVAEVMTNGSYHMHGVVGNTSCVLQDGSGDKLSFRSSYSGLVAFQPSYTNASSDFYDEFTVFPTPRLNASQTDG